MRIDADSTRRKGSAQAAFDAVHRGDVDILLGTQMVAKGHDFQRLTLVGVINPDTALFSQDYRAGERLFAQLMQVAGRAGRAAQAEVNHDGASQSEVLIQTRYPHHPLYQALLAHDYKGFADTLLAERRSANLPPYSFQALLRAEAKNLQLALDFLAQARTLMPHPGVSINDPVPMTITRVAGIERAQLLLEATSRAQLQAFLRPWMQALRSLKTRVNWMLEVDPIDIQTRCLHKVRLVTGQLIELAHPNGPAARAHESLEPYRCPPLYRLHDESRYKTTLLLSQALHCDRRTRTVQIRRPVAALQSSSSNQTQEWMPAVVRDNARTAGA